LSPDTRNLINNNVGLAAFVARVTPAWLGYPLAYFLSDRIAGRKSWAMVRAVRANQWVVSGEKLSGKALDRQVRETFRNTARSIYDLHHDIQKGEQARKLAAEDNLLSELLRRPRFAERGLMVVGLHMGNFDLMVQAAFMLGAQGLVLTLSDLPKGYKEQFEMRKQAGMELLPISKTALRKSIEHLKQGGVVLTGMDRPMEASPCRPRFFGRPSALPVGHIYLALKAHVPLIVTAVMRNPDHSYKLLSSEPLEMVESRDRDEELQVNADAACRLAEGFIRLAPEQWSMSFPVWPEALEEVGG
jgi:phosphatidylinositol dimannoside acyltransferase